MPTVTTYPGVFGPYTPITFTRASTATYFDSTGTLQSAAINAPRLDYNPSTLAAQGLLIEESRTNSIRNNTMVGAVAGTPGTDPANWTNTISAGITQQIVGTGTENGITYIDYRFSGTATGATVIRFDGETQVVASSGQAWTGSTYVKLVAGSLTNLGCSLNMRQGLAAGGLVLNTDVAFSPTSAALNTQRIVNSVASMQATTERIINRIIINSTGAIDITLRIGLPQLEQGAFATSVIPTDNTLALGKIRAADVASVNTLSPWYNATEGTLYGEFTRGYTGNFKDFTSPAVITNNLTGANANNISSVVTNGANQQLYNSMVVNNVEQLSYQQELAQTTNKVALAYKTNDTQQFTNGVAETADTSCTVPTSVSQMNIGAGHINIVFMNSWIRRITYYPRRLSQAEGIAITT